MYVTLLIWQLYYALATLRNTAWGTRASTHKEDAGETIVVRHEHPVALERSPALAAAAEPEGR
jgi:hypothetical protein